MKNLKKLLVTGGLMGIIMIGATTAKAGITIIGGRAEQDTTMTAAAKPCKEAKDLPSILGIILTDLKGLLVSDSKTKDGGCQSISLYGILLGD